jgi:hypothetical protein
MSDEFFDNLKIGICSRVISFFHNQEEVDKYQQSITNPNTTVRGAQVGAEPPGTVRKDTIKLSKAPPKDTKSLLKEEQMAYDQSTNLQRINAVENRFRGLLAGEEHNLQNSESQLRKLLEQMRYYDTQITVHKGAIQYMCTEKKDRAPVGTFFDTNRSGGGRITAAAAAPPPQRTPLECQNIIASLTRKKTDITRVIPKVLRKVERHRKMCHTHEIAIERIQAGKNVIDMNVYNSELIGVMKVVEDIQASLQTGTTIQEVQELTETHSQLISDTNEITEQLSLPLYGNDLGGGDLDESILEELYRDYNITETPLEYMRASPLPSPESMEFSTPVLDRQYGTYTTHPYKHHEVYPKESPEIFTSNMFNKPRRSGADAMDNTKMTEALFF